MAFADLTRHDDMLRILSSPKDINGVLRIINTETYKTTMSSIIVFCILHTVMMDLFDVFEAKLNRDYIVLPHMIAVDAQSKPIREIIAYINGMDLYYEPKGWYLTDILFFSNETPMVSFDELGEMLDEINKTNFVV